MTLSIDEKENIEEDTKIFDEEDDRNATTAKDFGRAIGKFRHTNDSTRTSKSTPQEPLRRSSRKRKSEDDSDGKSDALKQSTSPSNTTSKRSRPSSKYAPPSKYAHLTPLTDILTHNLICVFVGTNPGIRTATAGHAYAHPSNLFWKLLHSSGCTHERLQPSQDVELPRLYSMGNTNIVSRPSKDAAELSKAEMAAGTPILEAKFAKYRPEAVCIVGKGIWEAIWRWKYGREIKKHEWHYGWQEERMGAVSEEDASPDEEGQGPWEGARVFVATSTSGLAANLKPAEKEAIWKPFGRWVEERRQERATKEAEDTSTR